MTKAQNATSAKTFKSEFLEHYMAVSIGALSKKDTDALVMHLLDRYGLEEGAPLSKYPNQEVSALLRIPAAKVRQLRYEAGLKYGGRVEDQAKAKLLLADVYKRQVAMLRASKIDAVIGIGGGSALDAAKAIAGLLRPGNSVMDHLEGVCLLYTSRCV